ncbi:hypothetical protein GW17_00029456 [Ensete ventricosum]|nr:hypothetical protein GW17_00029456 [Ensete ventricosum]RZR92874.1 hypothetical protein BHM03_00021247 [Ensete ventricosum]
MCVCLQGYVQQLELQIGAQGQHGRVALGVVAGNREPWPESADAVDAEGKGHGNVEAVGAIVLQHRRNQPVTICKRWQT